MVNGTSGEQPPQGVSSSPRLSSVLQPLKIQQISETRKEWTWKEFAGRTVWEWLQLLIIPIVLAVATYSFNTLQNAHSEILATDQQRQTALDTYIDRMSDLLVAGNTGKVQDFPSMSFEVRRIARARTLIVLTTLDPARKKFVVQFLFDTKLIKNNNPLKADNPIVRLDYADLNRADLSGMYLGNVDFFDVDMMNASLSFAYLRYADISQSLLQGSDLSYAPAC